MSNANDPDLKGTDDFKVNKLNNGQLLPFYVDGTDALANKKQIITFYHVNSNHFVAFKAFITAYNETYSSDWASEQVYGRADPIYMFKSTTRKITLAFKVPAATISEAYENLTNIQKLLQYLYPNYKGLRPQAWDQESKSFAETPGDAHANTIAGAPLVRLGVMNLARRRDSAADGDQFRPDAEVAGGTLEGITFEAKSNLKLHMPATAQTGLLGTISNVNVNHNLEGEDGVFEQDGGALLPKMIEVNVDFNPIHESFLGWFDDGTFGNSAFPYGANDTKDDYYSAALTTAAEEGSTGTGELNPEEDERLPTATDDDPANQEEPPEDETSDQALAAADDASSFVGREILPDFENDPNALSHLADAAMRNDEILSAAEYRASLQGKIDADRAERLGQEAVSDFHARDDD